jgi:hypothetical protein
VVVGAGVAADPDGVEDAGFFAALLAAGVAPTPAGRSTRAWSPVDARLVASWPVRRILSVVPRSPAKWPTRGAALSCLGHDRGPSAAHREDSPLVGDTLQDVAASGFELDA